MPNARALPFAMDYVAWIYPLHQAHSIAQSLAKVASTTKAKANSPSFDNSIKQEIIVPARDKNMEIDKIYNIDCLEGMKHIPDGSIDAIK